MTREEFCKLSAAEFCSPIKDPFPEVTQRQRDNSLIQYMNDRRGFFDREIPLRASSISEPSTHRAYQMGWDAAWMLVRDTTQGMVDREVPAKEKP